MVKLDPSSERQIRSLRFEGALEREFRDFFTDDSLTRLRVGLVLLALLTVPQIVAGIGRPAGPPGAGSPMSDLNLARVLIAGPIPLAIIALTFRRRLRRLAVPATVLFQLLMQALPVIYGERLADLTPLVGYTFVSAVLVVSAMRLPTLVAAAYAACAWGLALLNLATAGAHLRGLAPTLLILLFGMMLLIVGAYYNETAVRRSFLLGRLLEQERAKTEAVLANTLPKAIAERLKNAKEPIAEFHADATVLFADVAGFTAFTASRPPGEVVALLNQLFSQFDSLVSASSLEKIKTVGDAYMVAGGVLDSAPDHARQMARLALDMVAVAASMGIEVRIGVDAGPVVGGVLGTSKYSYDLWGTTVNRASRMQTVGKPNAVHVTDAFAEAAGADFQFEAGEEQDLKGIGTVRGLWLVGGRGNASYGDRVRGPGACKLPL